MFFNILAAFAEFEVDLLRMRTREGMAVARAKGKLRGKQPKLSPKQQRELVRMAGSGEYTIADLAELFTVSRTTIYRTLQRHYGTARCPHPQLLNVGFALKATEPPDWPGLPLPFVCTW